MSKWLASVQSLEEACTLLPALPDILDMKDPSKGALGALTVGAVSKIVSVIDGQCLTSATIGDLPMSADVIADAMLNMSRSGVDYVKIGLFPDADLANCIMMLKGTVKTLKIPVIAVIFADKPPKMDVIPLLKESGFGGVMVDTAIKNGQCLLDHWGESELMSFVNAARQQGMLCGLAGALKYEDVAVLQPLGADYLGFRSALCEQRQRTSTLQLILAEKIQQEINKAMIPAE